MCGRFVLQDPEAIPERFQVQVDFRETHIDPVPRFNVAPSQQVPIVIETEQGRTLRSARWGFRPAWMRGADKRPAPINARSETLLDRPMFRSSVARHRCIIPASGYYEWQVVPGRKQKQPWFYHLAEGGLFGFAGLWADSAEGPTCTIVTTAANELAAPVHDRMPVILLPEAEGVWLDPSETSPVVALACLKPYPPERMRAHPVDQLVSSVGSGGPELIEPLSRRE